MNLFNFCVSYDIRLLKAVVGSYDYNVITLLDLLGVVYVVEDLAVLILNRLDVVRVNGLGKIILIEFLILTVVVSIVDLFVSIVIDLDGESHCLSICAVAAGLIHVVCIVPPSCFDDVIVEVLIIDSKLLAGLNFVLSLDALKDISADTAVDNEINADTDKSQSYNADCNEDCDKAALALLLWCIGYRCRSNCRNRT